MMNPAHLHLLRPQTLRMWKLITYSGTAYLSFFMVFKADYSSTTDRHGEHCFSDVSETAARVPGACFDTRILLMSRIQLLHSHGGACSWPDGARCSIRLVNSMDKMHAMHQGGSHDPVADE